MADETAVPNTNGTPTPDQPTAPGQPPVQPEKTFTQAELDRLITERLKREKEKHADYDDLKKAADELKAIKESQLSETEKLTKRLAELETAKTQAETRARETLIRSAVISEAAKLNFNDPDDAYRLLDLSTVKVDDTGKVEGAIEAVKALAESRKYLIKQSSGRPLEPFDPAAAGGTLKETREQRMARLYSGGGQQFFDAEAAQRAGGGVIWPKGKPE